jgi:hypothetical protein
MKPAVTLKQWLSVDVNRRAKLSVECGEVVVVLTGENLRWRGRGDDAAAATDRALLAREKVHGSAL